MIRRILQRTTLKDQHRSFAVLGGPSCDGVRGSTTNGNVAILGTDDVGEGSMAASIQRRQAMILAAGLVACTG
jgi:hypothetical protein